MHCSDLYKSKRIFQLEIFKKTLFNFLIKTLRNKMYFFLLICLVTQKDKVIYSIVLKRAFIIPYLAIFQQFRPSVHISYCSPLKF